eukprot:TRINITY_DN23716_c0_g1_i1.p1 TRINITY_DN23716_c0_g1~~TRINITY_DN23716_c0_g1_i1.p1  ORF type:complete len:508 (+),score=138.17 TRINITY_DN23716_c0_g1_i1:64-1587(+)
MLWVFAAAAAAGWLGEDADLRKAVEAAGLSGCSVRRVAAASLSASEFRRQVIDSGEPAVLTGVDPIGPQRDEWLDRDSLSKRWGDHHFRVRLSTGNNQVGAVERVVSLADYIPRMHEAGSGLLFDQGHDAGWTCPERFAESGLCQPVLSIGAAGTGLPLHNHNAAWETPVVGRKLVLLAEPASNTSWMPPTEEWRYAAPRRFLSSTLSIVKSGGWPSEWFPSTAATGHCLLEPGEVVWIPCNWYHATLNLGDVVAVGGQRVLAQSGSEKCADDAHIVTRQALFAAQQPEGLPVPAESVLSTLNAVCRIVSANVHCTPLRAMAIAREGRPAQAVQTVHAAARLWAQWWRAGYTTAEVLGAVLSHFAEVLREPGPLELHRPAERLARLLLHDAVTLDPRRQNLRARTLRVGLLLATPDGAGPDAPEHALWEANQLMRELGDGAAAARLQYRVGATFPVAVEDGDLMEALKVTVAMASGLEAREPPKAPEGLMLLRSAVRKAAVEARDEL